MSETDSVSSFFKRKKKPKQVKTVDFDELFARGHAMSAQLEQTIEQQNRYGLRAEVTGPTIHPPTTSAPSTPFELFSKENAFKMSQKGSGIGYEEKVASYLSDQQSTVFPSNHHQGQPFLELDRAHDQADAPQRQQRSPYYEAERPASALDQSSSKQQAHLSPCSEPPQRGSKSPYSYRGQTKLGKSVSPSTSGITAKKQMTSQEFLNKIQDFVKKAEMDGRFTQPVWPAVVQSPSDLPPMKPVEEDITLGKSNTLLAPPRYGPKAREHSPLGPAEPSIFDSVMPQSFTDNRNQLSADTHSEPYIQGGTSLGIAPSSGKGYLDKPSTSPDPFGAKSFEVDLPPTPSDAASIVSSSILSSLRRPNRRKTNKDEVLSLIHI